MTQYHGCMPILVTGAMYDIHAITLAASGEADEAEMGERHRVDHTTLCQAHPHAPQYVFELR